MMFVQNDSGSFEAAINISSSGKKAVRCGVKLFQVIKAVNRATGGTPVRVK